MKSPASTIDDEATAFAMELLMPTKFLRAALSEIGPFDIDDEVPIKKLAAKFKVSPQVMFLRLAKYPH
jgi:Zn-dependent peptidase ImmA (M78 family)